MKVSAMACLGQEGLCSSGSVGATLKEKGGHWDIFSWGVVWSEREGFELINCSLLLWGGKVGRRPEEKRLKAHFGDAPLKGDEAGTSSPREQ